MGKHPAAYKSEKRRKELARLKRQEEKRLKHQKKSESEPQEPEKAPDPVVTNEPQPSPE